MGIVTVVIEGSFTRDVRDAFSAEDGGHAMAISRAIASLNEQMPAAIKRDHDLHERDNRPPKSGFGTLPDTDPT